MINPFRLPSIMNPRRGHQPPVTRPYLMQDEPEPAETDYFSELRRLREEIGPAMTGYKDLLNQQPRMEDYTPNRWTRFGAALSGMGAGLQGQNGAEIAYNINAAPYREALADYSSRLENSRNAASLEHEEKQDRVQDLYAAQNFGLKVSEYKRKMLETQGDINYKQGQSRAQNVTADAAQQRAAAYAQSIDDQNWEATPQMDGSVLQINRRTGQRRRISADSVAAFTAQSGRISANASATSAAAAQQNANTNTARQEVDALDSGARRSMLGQQGRYYGFLAEGGGAANRRQSPGQQSVAIQTSLAMLAKDPQVANYITGPDEDGNFSYVPDDGSAGYKIFKRRLQQTTESQLNRGTPFEELEDDDEFEDLGPGGY